MGKLLGTLLRSVRHPQNSGQAIIVLALGFIGLVGFVGIVTDVSILLARYNTLARAVDSAAISAAGQMRSDRSFGEVGLAARMMLELHGVNSTEVMVETCASSGNVAPDPVLCSEANRYRKLVRVGATVMSPTVFLRLLGIEDIEISAVSTSETAVLDIVMVMDVSESMLLDTTYEDWADIGFGQVYVPPSAGLSVADPNPSILKRERDAGVFAIPSNDPGDLLYDDAIQFWAEQLLGGVGTAPSSSRIRPHTINQRLSYTVAGSGANILPDSPIENPNYRVRAFPLPTAVGAQNHPRTACRVRFWPGAVNSAIPTHIRTIPGFATYWEGNTPSQTSNLSQTVSWSGFVPTFDFYGCCNDPTNGGFIDDNGNLQPLPGGSPATYATETPDWRFNDLICQPFKEARDAAREFLNTIDFDRGDRVAFVTFDRGAYLIDPDGSEGRVDAGNTDECPRDPEPAEGKTTWTHMLASLCRAERTLDQFIGVRAEPNFYAWKEEGGGWFAYADGRNADGTPNLVDYYHEAGPAAPHYSAEDQPLDLYPVQGVCPFSNATLTGFASVYSLWDWGYKGPTGMTHYGRSTTNGGLYRIMTPNAYTNSAWGALGPTQSYEYWASCRGTNIGAGLREGNNALLDPATTRRTGTVWVMILLSDGAAGASDPVRLNGRKPLEAAPFRDYGPDSTQWQTYQGVDDLIRYGQAGEYGAFGLCPIGTPTNRSRLTRANVGAVSEFPYCGDTLPETRHFCLPLNKDSNNVGKKCPSGGGLSYGFAPGSFDVDYDCNIPFDDNLVLGRVYDVDMGDFPNEAAADCDEFYDVDDYARDWADYVSISRTGAGDEQLPTIFTIGFGLNFLRQNASGYIDLSEDPSDPGYEPHSAQFNTMDFLGEELLRYIADVGDNFQVDTDYQQDLRQHRTLFGYMDVSIQDPETFGQRGPCEDQNIGPDGSGQYPGLDSLALMGNGFSTEDGGSGTMVRPLPPRQDCGNYYNAPDQGRLQLVFDDIASRMFTRLAP